MMTKIKAFAREPLIHFLLMGLVLFIIFRLINGDLSANNPNAIEVKRENLLSFMQYRARNFNDDRFADQLDGMGAEQRQTLIDEYVREEVLYREAKALALDSNDYVARQRLIQQMRYLTESFIRVRLDDSDAAVQAYLTDNSERYRKPAEATFTHVFYSTERRSIDDARSLALEQIQELNQLDVPFHKAPGFGERFLYHRNYVNKPDDLIASHFGDEMQQAVFQLTPSHTQWQGPYQSPYGFHLVLVTQSTAAFIPPLSDLRGQLLSDMGREEQRQAVEKAIKSIIENYKVTVAIHSPVTAANGMANINNFAASSSASNSLVNNDSTTDSLFVMAAE